MLPENRAMNTEKKEKKKSDFFFLKPILKLLYPNRKQGYTFFFLLFLGLCLGNASKHIQAFAIS